MSHGSGADVGPTTPDDTPSEGRTSLTAATQRVVDRTWSRQRAAEELNVSELEYNELCWDEFANRPFARCCPHIVVRQGVNMTLGNGLPKTTNVCDVCGSVWPRYEGAK